jgi:hypothetical protein
MLVFGIPWKTELENGHLLLRIYVIISAVNGLEHEEAFSASRLPQRSGARNIATREYINIVKEENTASRGMPLEWKISELDHS